MKNHPEPSYKENPEQIIHIIKLKGYPNKTEAIKLHHNYKKKFYKEKKWYTFLLLLIYFVQYSLLFY